MGFSSFDFADEVSFSLQVAGGSNLPTAGDTLDIWTKTNAALSQYFQTGKGTLADNDPNNIWTSMDLNWGPGPDPSHPIYGINYLLSDAASPADVQNFIDTIMNPKLTDPSVQYQFSGATITALLGAILKHWNTADPSPSPTYQAMVQQYGQVVSSDGTVKTAPGQAEIKTVGNFMTTITSALQTIKDAGTTVAGIFSSLSQQGFL